MVLGSLRADMFTEIVDISASKEKMIECCWNRYSRWREPSSAPWDLTVSAT